MCEFDENYIFKFSQQENKGTWTWQTILDGAEHQHAKDAKIISELLEIIEMQNKQICILHNYIQHNEDNLVGDDLKGDDRFTERFRRHIISTKAVLSETESKLKQLIKGE
jgi:hypothetical protein